MKDLNKVMLTGKVGRDVELRVTPNGSSVAAMSVASNRCVKQPDGTWKDQPEWFRVVLWGHLAERAVTYLKKGSRVLIEGRLETRTYTDGNGNERTSPEVIATELLMLDTRRTNTESEELPFAPGDSRGKVDELEAEGIPF